MLPIYIFLSLYLSLFISFFLSSSHSLFLFLSLFLPLSLSLAFYLSLLFCLSVPLLPPYPISLSLSLSPSLFLLLSISHSCLSHSYALSAFIFFICLLFFLVDLVGYKIELTAEEQAMSYPGQKVDPEEALGSGIGPGTSSQPQRDGNRYARIN